MKRVTSKTALNIYQEAMTLSVMDLRLENINITYDVLQNISKQNYFELKINYLLKDYTDKQVQKIIKGLESHIQREAAYLKDEMLHFLKSNLRERKLNKIL